MNSAQEKEGGNRKIPAFPIRSRFWTGRLWVGMENGTVFLQLDFFHLLSVTDNSDVLFHPGILELDEHL